MHTNHYIILAILALFFNCSKQSRIDTVDKRLNTVSEIHELATKDPDSFFTELKKAQKLINQGGISDSIKGVNDFLLGRYYARNKNLDSAAVYFYSATEAVRDSIVDISQVNRFNFAWNVHSRLGKYGDCLALSRRYASLIDEDDPYAWTAFTHYMDANVYLRTKEYAKAIESNEKRISIYRQVNDTVSIIPTLMSQAEAQFNIGNKKKGFETLDELVKKETYLRDSDNHKLFSDYAVYLSKENNYRHSFKYHIKGINYAKKLTHNAKDRILATSYSNTANVLIKLKRYDQATKYIDSAKQLNLNITSKSLQRQVLKHELRLAMFNKNRAEDVLIHLDSIYDFQNKVYEEKYDKELVALTAAAEKEKIILKEKQEAEIQSLKLKSRQQFLFLFIGLLGIIGYLFFRQRKLGFERQQLQMQQRLLRSQMNPHFTSNILYSIQNLVKKSPEEASKYLVKFSRLLRLVLENSMSNYVQLEDELETLKKYLDLQSLRYDSRFAYAFELNNLEEDDLVFIPPMLIQPIAENSIEHGLLDLDYPGKLKITLTAKKKFIECVVEDNGKGMSDKTNRHKQSASTKLINDFLRKTTKSELKVINKTDIDNTQSGVLVKFLIPFKLTEHD